MPIDELIAAGTCPVEVVSFAPEFSPVMPQFAVTLKNLSDKKVKLINWTVMVFDENGQLLPEGKVDSGYGELGGIAPGETIEGLMPSLEGAVSGKIVIKSVVYESQPPGAEDNQALQRMTIAMTWENPSYEAEVAALE
jgi:hypothetical protein